MAFDVLGFDTADWPIDLLDYTICGMRSVRYSEGEQETLKTS